MLYVLLIIRQMVEPTVSTPNASLRIFSWQFYFLAKISIRTIFFLLKISGRGFDLRLHVFIDQQPAIARQYFYLSHLYCINE